MSARGEPVLRRRLVPGSVERQRDTPLHPRSEAAQDPDQIRQEPIQAPKPDRDHVWAAQGLEARGNPLRQMPEGLPLSNRTRGNCHLLAMSPDPKTADRREKQIAVAATIP